MSFIEQIRGKEGITESKKRIVIIGSNAGDGVWKLAIRLQEHLVETGLNSIKVDAVRNTYDFKDAIEGLTVKGDIEPKAIAVLVGQEARNYGPAGGITLNIDRKGIMENIRNICGPNIYIGRFSKNKDGSYDFYPDGQSNNVTPMLPPVND